MSRRKQADALRAGIWLSVGVVIFTFAIFLLGQKSALFTRTTSLYVSFRDISGIGVGSPVRLAGLEVGTVAELILPDDIDTQETRVRLVVQTRYMERIREDSRAYIDTAGLLGDKIVNISMGSSQAKRLEDGGTLKPGETVNFQALSSNVDEAIRSVANITKSLDSLVQDESTAKLQTDVGRIASSLANILSTVETGPGLAHRLLYDPKYAEQVEAILSDARTLASKADGAVGRVDRVLYEVEKGNGTLHDVIYGENGKQALADLSAAARDIDGVVREVKEGKGVLHSLVYEEGNSNFLRDLNELSATLNRVVQDIDKGRGTIGGLVKDPTVYEDLKTTLGNVQRNVILKALIRYTMDKEGLRRGENAPNVEEQDATSRSHKE